MKTRNMWVLAMGFYLSLAGIAFAENIQGTITSVNPDNRSLTIAPKDPSAGLPSEINLQVKDEKNFKGIQSLDALAVGDEVKVEAERKNDGNWEVKSLEKNNAAQADSMASSNMNKTAGANSATSQPSSY